MGAEVELTWTAARRAPRLEEPPSGAKIQYWFAKASATQTLPVLGSIAGHQVWQHGLGCVGPLFSHRSSSAGAGDATGVDVADGDGVGGVVAASEAAGSELGLGPAPELSDAVPLHAATRIDSTTRPRRPWSGGGACAISSFVGLTPVGPSVV